MGGIFAMKQIIKYFLNGLLVVTPIVASIYIVSYVFSLIDGIGKKALYWFIPYVPVGLGLLLTIVVLVVIGWLSQYWITQKLISGIDRLFNQFPLLKTIYNSVKDTLRSFVGDQKSFSQVVMIHEGNGVKQIGFLTTEDVSLFGCSRDYIAVYIPHGLQVAGVLKLFPRNQVEMLDVSVEEAMRFCVTAGVARKKDVTSPKKTNMNVTLSRLVEKNK
jgi:uncharacterized membrane protein